MRKRPRKRLLNIERSSAVSTRVPGVTADSALGRETVIPRESSVEAAGYRFGAQASCHELVDLRRKNNPWPSFAGRTVIFTRPTWPREVTARELARVGAKVILPCALRQGRRGAAGMTVSVDGAARLSGLALCALFIATACTASTSRQQRRASCRAVRSDRGRVESHIAPPPRHFALTNLFRPKSHERVVHGSSMMHLFGYTPQDRQLEVARNSEWCLRTVQAGQLLFHQGTAAPPLRGGVAVKAHAAHPGLLRTTCRATAVPQVGDAVDVYGNKLAPMPTSRTPTLYALAVPCQAAQLHRAPLAMARGDSVRPRSAATGPSPEDLPPRSGAVRAAH